MNKALIVAGKEILDNARDRRAVFSSMLFGPIFGPLLFAVLINTMVSRNLATIEAPIDVPIVGADQAANLVAFLGSQRIRPAENRHFDSIEQGADAVRSGNEDLVIFVDDAYEDAFGSEALARVTMVYDRSNSQADSTVDRVRAALAGYRNQVGSLRLLARGIHPDILRPLTVDEYDVSTPAGRSALLLGMLTYFLLLATLMGGMYLAIDATAGERERRSLEPLLATPVSRGSLLLGKMAATVCYMLLALALTVTAFTIALDFLPLEQLGMSSSFGFGKAVLVFLIIAPFTPLGAALMTLIASFTKSYKEAQTYLGFIMLVPTLPLILASILNIRPSLGLMWIPSLSQHLLIQNLIREEPIETSMIVVATVSTLLASVAVAWGAIRLYKREALLG